MFFIAKQQLIWLLVVASCLPCAFARGSVVGVGSECWNSMTFAAAHENSKHSRENDEDSDPERQVVDLLLKGMISTSDRGHELGASQECLSRLVNFELELDVIYWLSSQLIQEAKVSGGVVFRPPKATDFSLVC